MVTLSELPGLTEMLRFGRTVTQLAEAGAEDRYPSEPRLLK
jgi:hypothetical protein